MRIRPGLWVIALALLGIGCASDDPGATADPEQSTSIASDQITPNEVNRYQLDAVGGFRFSHTGGLICSVVDGELILDFSVDASDGEYDYGAVFPSFDPGASQMDGTFTIVFAGGGEATGTVTLWFGFAAGPAEYPGVVTAAGEFGGPVRSSSRGGAELIGAYACFLTHSEVGL